MDPSCATRDNRTSDCQCRIQQTRTYAGRVAIDRRLPLPVREHRKQQSRSRDRKGDKGEAAPAVLTPVVLVVWAGCERGMRVVSRSSPPTALPRYRSGIDGLLSAAEIRPEREPTRGSVALPLRGVVLARRVTPANDTAEVAVSGRLRVRVARSKSARCWRLPLRDRRAGARRGRSQRTRANRLYERGTAVKPRAFTSVSPSTTSPSP